MEEDIFICEICENPVAEENDFCPHCGSIYIEVKCLNHEEKDADGVCVICAEPLCEDCFGDNDEVILCENHAGYEIYKSVAKVYDTQDEDKMLFYKNVMDENDIHNLVFSVKVSTKTENDAAPGEIAYSVEETVDEYKLMVPLNLVLEAEEILSQTEYDENEQEP